MKSFEIVAHRGASNIAPENTIEAFQHAIEYGADAIEFDVRLTSDGVPVIYHYFYLEEITNTSGPIFNITCDQLQKVKVLGRNNQKNNNYRILTLNKLLEIIGNQIALEIEIKGPEPESSEIIGEVLRRFKHLWKNIEVTSYEPILLNAIRKQCPGIVTDLLFPLSENWMKPDVITYLAIQRARLAQVRAIHLHPTQLSSKTVSTIRKYGIEIHSWDVNDKKSLETINELKIPRICTDNLQKALNFRQATLKSRNKKNNMDK
ncbi:MAG: glycerophosphodiester phosphodiesterase [Candidatus Hermodarchaeota archaeon]